MEIEERESEESTRRRVAGEIMRHGPSTAHELAERLALTPSAVRRHLSALVEAGRLVARDPRPPVDRGRGRPAHHFALTDEGRAAFRQSYDDLAIRAIDFLAATGGPDAVRAFADERVAEVESRFAALRATDPALDPTDALARALTAEGFVATAQPAAAGIQLCQRHCPVAHVAARYPQLCEAETAMFARALGSHVQRLATIAHGDNVCTTHIPSRPAGPRGDR